MWLKENSFQKKLMFWYLVKWHKDFNSLSVKIQEQLQRMSPYLDESPVCVCVCVCSFFLCCEIVWVLPTLFYVQDLARIDLHLGLAISITPGQPAVAGEHVLLSMDRNHQLNAVQEPAGTHAFIGVANHQTVDLELDFKRMTISTFDEGLHRFTEESDKDMLIKLKVENRTKAFLQSRILHLFL